MQSKFFKSIAHGISINTELREKKLLEKLDDESLEDMHAWIEELEGLYSYLDAEIIEAHKSLNQRGYEISKMLGLVA